MVKKAQSVKREFGGVWLGNKLFEMLGLDDFFTFVLWKAFGLMVKNAGLGDEPRRVFEEIKTICMVDVVLTTTEGNELKIRTIPRPEKPLQILLHRLGLNLPILAMSTSWGNVSYNRTGDLYRL